MSLKAYEFLTESFLFDPSLLAQSFEQVSERELQGELDRYHEFNSSNMGALLDEVPFGSGSNLFHGHLPDLAAIKRTLLYVPCHVVSDPLLSLAQTERTRVGRPLMAAAGLKDEPLDRGQLSDVLKALKAMKPLVKANCFKLWPKDVRADASPATEILYSECLFRDQLPHSVATLMRDRAVTRSVFVSGGVSYVRPTLDPCRMISITFRDGNPKSGYTYVLHRVASTDVDSETGSPRLLLSLPTTPPSDEDFQAWVEQSVNLAASTFCKSLLADFADAERCGASLNLNNSLSLNVLNTLSVDTGGLKSSAANALLNLKLPLLDDVDLDTLVRVRQEEGEAFQAFRRAFEVGVRELRATTDPALLKIRQENFVHELAELQVAECESKVVKLRKKLAIEAAVGILGVTAAIQTGGWSLLGALTAMMQGYKTYEEYAATRSTTPGYFLWRLSKQAEA